ncbi:VP12 [California hare coltivirus]|nr:VP12 [California hare coltivirus]
MPCNRAVFGAFILAVLIGLQSAYFKLYEFYRNNDNAKNTTASVFLKRHEVAINVIVEFAFDILFFLCGLLGFELTPTARKLIFRKTASAAKADVVELSNVSSRRRNDPEDGERVRNVSKTSLLSGLQPVDRLDRDPGTSSPPAYSPADFHPPPPIAHVYETPTTARVAPSAPSFGLFNAGGLAGH